MNKIYNKYLIILIVSQLIPKICFSQFSAADSAAMLGWYDHPIYIDTSVTPGNWLHNPEPSSFYNHYLMLDTSFKFNTLDLDNIQSLTLTDSLQYDTAINNSFNVNPALLNQQNPMVYLPFTLNNKTGKAYTIYYPDTTSNYCKNAFLIVPGSGRNQAYDIVRGVGYHNTLCSMKNNCLNFGDVFTLVKPNEESRAYHWGNNKLNSWIFWYLSSANTYYGTNYLIEIIAMIQYLKSKYDKVFLFGLSEGGYASLLSTFYIQPDVALISGGYSVNFDTCTDEKDYLRLRFDTLVDYYDRIQVKNKILNSSCQYMFTWGDGDPVLTMDPDHDFHYTENYFNGLSNCSYFYDFLDHTFPPCINIDTFIQRNLSVPKAHYFITDTSIIDTMKTQVRFCNSGQFQFDLFRNNSFYQAYTSVTDSINIPLSDSGWYSIRNVIDTNLIAGECVDSIYCNKYPVSFPVEVSNTSTLHNSIKYNNPFQHKLLIDLSAIANPVSIQVKSIYGIQVFCKNSSKSAMFTIDTEQWSTGNYILQISDSKNFTTFKLLKN
jgi:hypothetical protein